jgi:WD40 repeat protein
MAFHPSGERLFTGGLDRLVTMSDPAKGREILVFRELGRVCFCLAFSPNGDRLAAASGDGTIHVWDARPLSGTEDKSLYTLQYPGEQVWGLDVSPDGGAIAVAGKALESHPNQAAPVVSWGIPGLQKRRQLPGLSIIVFSVAYDPTGRFLAFCGDEQPRQPGKALVQETGSKGLSFSDERANPRPEGSLKRAPSYNRGAFPAGAPDAPWSTP